MSVMQSEVYEAFRAIDIPEDKALIAATALSERDDDVTGVKGELLPIKWMMGFVLAFLNPAPRFAPALRAARRRKARW